MNVLSICENNNQPICIYLDFCSMWKQCEQKIFNYSLKYFSFNNSYLAITLCLTHRVQYYERNTEIIIQDMFTMAKNNQRDLKIIYQKIYGSNTSKMFFIMFEVK